MVRARPTVLLLVLLAVTSVFSGLATLAAELAPAAADTSGTTVGDYYGVLVLTGLPALDTNEEDISPDGQWVIAGSLNPTSSNPYYLFQINETPGTSPSVVSANKITDRASVAAAEAQHGITTGGATASLGPIPSIPHCGSSVAEGVNSSGIVSGTTLLSPPNGGAASPDCGAFVSSAATGPEILDNHMGNANFFAYRAWGISNNGFIVGDGQTQRGFDVAYLAYPAEPPTVTSVTPGAGITDGGTTVTIEGTNFNTNGGTGFEFGVTTGNSPQLSPGKPATNVVCTTTTLCTATAPPLAQGTFDVYAATGVGDSQASPPDDQFTYFARPTVDSVDSGAGPIDGGNTVRILGEGFEAPGLTLQKVTFDPAGDTDGSQALPAHDVHLVSDNEIDVTVPNGTDAANGASNLDTAVTLVYSDGDDNKVDSVPSSAGVNDYSYKQTATISQAGMYGTSANPTIVILGSGFRTMPDPVTPCPSGGENYAHNDLTFVDLTTLAGTGDVGDCIGLDVTTFTDSEIVFTFGAGYANDPKLTPGDTFQVSVSGAEYTGTVAFNSQTVTFNTTPAPNPTPGGATYTPAATTTAPGLTVVITVDPTSAGVCSIADGVVTFLAAGICTLDGDQPGGGLYPAAPTTQQDIVVNPGPAEIVSFINGTGGSGATDTVTLPTASYVASAMGSGGGAITYSIGSGSNGCTVDPSSGAVTFTPAGTCVVDAAAAANGNYGASTSDATLTIADLQSQTVSFTNGTGVLGAIDTVTLPDTTYVANASGSGGGAVTYSIDVVSNGCTVDPSSGAVTFTAFGTCVIDAVAAANATYAASSTEATLAITVAPAPQAITFGAIAAQTLAAAPFTVSATASSGLPATFITSTPSVCTAGGNHGAIITLLTTGTCTMEADQAGNGFYAGAQQVVRSFKVT